VFGADAKVGLEVTANTKNAVDGVDAVSGAIDNAGKKVETFGERLGKMNPKELAERIMSLEQNFQGVSDVMEGIATNDAKKFEQGMSSAMRGVVGVVGLIAPEFAPLVAILAPLVTKTVEWALGMDQAAEAAKKLADETKKVTDELKDQNDEIDYQTKLEKLRAHDRQTNLELDLEALRQKGEAEANLYLKRLEMNNLTEEEIKAHTKFVEDQGREEAFINAEIQAAITTQELEEIKKRGREAEQAQKERHSNEQQEEREHAQAVREIQAEMIEGQKTGFIAFQNYMHGARFAGAKAAADADKMISDSAKKAADAQIKAAQDARQKVVDSYTTMANIVKTLMTDWKAGVGQILDLLTKAVQDNMMKQLVAVQTSNSSATTSNAAYTASSQAQAGARAAAATSEIAPKAVSAYAGIPFIGVALATAAIAAFFGLIRSKIGMQEGYVGDGRVPGMGRNDDIDAKINSRESVMNEGAPEALGRMILDMANRGGGGISGGGGGTDKTEIEFSFREPTTAFMRELIQMIDVQVTRGRAKLTATHMAA
jgi:hypothetical protein